MTSVTGGLLVLFASIITLTNSQELPKLYEYYIKDGIITSGLNASQQNFTLNGREIFIYSGTVHYFRVPRQYWRDRLRKVRAAGLNAVETYIPWNLHEVYNGTYDFGDGGTEMQDFLHLEEFLKIVKEEDLFAIIRPGPYICAEWENGGIPSWLLREPDIMFRSSEKNYINYVTRYYNVLLPKLAPFQFKNGGPIIAVQVENEYGSMQSSDFFPQQEYLLALRQLLLNHNITELLVTSDNYYWGTAGTLPGVLHQTVNFGSDPKTAFDALKSMQPGKPIMVMEYWPGWFDFVGQKHETRSAADFRNIYETILTYPASGNMYMFHGGTNWGWTNGASDESQPTNNSLLTLVTTSYDYDSPLSEAGDYTEKYNITAELLKKYNPFQTKLPDRPQQIAKTAFADIEIEQYLDLYDVINNFGGPGIVSEKPIAVELLPINNNSGQPFGYTVYRKKLDLPPNSTLKIEGRVCDHVLVLVNGQLINNQPLNSLNDFNNFGYWSIENSTIILNSGNNLANATLDLVVENWGRTNWGIPTQWKQYKGLWQGGVLLNEQELFNWTIIPLEFKKNWTNNLSGWSQNVNTAPGLYKSFLNLTDAPTEDTFIDIRNWNRGIIIVNGFVLGRHAAVGPQLALYLPAPFLRKGVNEIIIFEHFRASAKLQFSDQPIFTSIL